MSITLKFTHQPFQEKAAIAVREVFRGQQRGSLTFEQQKRDAQQKEITQTFSVWANNPVNLSDEQLLSNLRKVQKDNGLPPSDNLEGKYNLTVEMETGTGKTYTYIKTIHELYREYGWSKYIIVVPSIAIREGVHKSFATTAEHFREDYGENIDYFIYDSGNVSRLLQFVSDNGIQVMIINSQAFNAKDANTRRIRTPMEGFFGHVPLEVIAGTNPIMIIDEPQSVEGERTKEAIKDFCPLFTLRYSATPRERYNMVYRLTAKDAYDKHLVKKIRVTGLSVSNASASEGYVYMKGIIRSKNNPRALMEFDRRTADGIRRITRQLDENDDLYDLSGRLDEYRHGFIVRVIDGLNDCVEFLNGTKIAPGEVIGSSIEEDLRRIQIRETIEEHLKKERELYGKGIKVLSLFFIDEVAKYRLYDSEGSPTSGIYARIFEEEYSDAVRHFIGGTADEKYTGYLETIDVGRTHSGYFSIDKHNRMIDSKTGRDGTADDVKAFDLIMRDKERLLNIGEPVRFIFSHSALREGWDNPNVFQICTLKNSTNDVRRRQEVGRGLRLAVNQDGQRIQDEDVNVLTVIASESYREFSEGLQHEIEETSGRRENIEIQDGRKTGKRVTLNTEKFASPEFAELWRRINRKTLYRVDFDDEELIREAAARMNDGLKISGVIVNIESGVMNADNDGITFTRDNLYSRRITSNNTVNYDLVGRLSALTGLTRRVAAKILGKLNRETFAMFRTNPEVFMSNAAMIIHAVRSEMVSKHVRYIALDDAYGTDIFRPEYETDDDLQETERNGLYDAVPCDSDVEKRFAAAMDISRNVALFTKLPHEFTIATPAGMYNPDWAAVSRTGRYIVAETKGSAKSGSLRGVEMAKTECARKHFAVLGSEVDYELVANYEELLGRLTV